MTEIKLLHCLIAGTSHRPIAELKAAETEMCERADGDLRLELEPENKHDRNAIKVLTPRGVFLGYVPMGPNAPIARLIGAGKDVRARLGKVGWERTFKGPILKAQLSVFLVEGDAPGKA